SVQYPFASDYDRVPIVVIGPQNKPSVDWRTKGVVTGVKNQGQCQSDYAFSATGVMEAAWGISKGQLISLSEQQLIDCDAANNGCSGGSTVRAIEYVIAHHGITTEQAYPYTAQDGSCKNSTAAVTITSLSRPDPGNESALEEFVAGKAPVSAVLRIDSSAWDNYSGGIFDPAAGTPIPPRYVAVLIVGYDVLGGTPYWIVKGSYGTSWGNQGYAFVRRGQNALGIANFVVCPTV
ncbi:MAG TPA: C1 family peptidase, partial [Blastocatellia bacterium]|nr:C1 family peptidase [Blastocatellia bacterium]